VKGIKAIVFSLVIFFCFDGIAQRIELKGQLIAEEDTEGLHILNKTAFKYDISSETGQFTIPAQENDTIVISGLKYENKEIIITQTDIRKGVLNVVLVEKINQLDEVIVGRIFTGSLESDLENTDAKPPINFYDLGLPGSTKLPMTQNERKLLDADGGTTASIMGGPFGGGMGVNLHKLLNTISGRTKRLRAIVALDNKDKCTERLRREYESILFETDNLKENFRTEFFLFAQESAGFLPMCQRKNDIEAIDFLKNKLKEYNEQRIDSVKN
jgi:hypothetical protein